MPRGLRMNPRCSRCRRRWIEMPRDVEPRRSGVYRLSDEERTAVRAGMEAARRGDFVPEEEMDALNRWHRHSGARASRANPESRDSGSALRASRNDGD